MKRFLEYLRVKGFYVALGVGIVAFAGLIYLYDYKKGNEDISEEQVIDLNKSKLPEDKDKNEKVASDDDKKKNDDVVEEAKNKKEIKKDNKEKEEKKNSEVATAGSSDAIAEPKVTEENVEAGSDAAVPDIKAGLNYEGEKVLSLPVEGEVILPYSMDSTVYFETLDSYKCNPGMLLQGEQGTSVFSAYEGVVESINETKEYGTVVTVDMGNGYKAIYGQMMNLAVREGDNVAKAQMLGQIGTVSSYYKMEGSHLFFEITKDGRPINPLSLIQ